MTGLPAPILQRIADTTGLDPRLGRRARATVCPRCHQPVLTGLDEDRCAFTATTDPVALTTVGEALALISGRATYQLTGRPPHLLHRDQWRISGQPADTAIVLPSHQCGAPPLPTRAVDKPPANRKSGGDECPF